MQMLMKLLMHTITTAVYFAEQANLVDIVEKLQRILMEIKKKSLMKS